MNLEELVKKCERFKSVDVSDEIMDIEYDIEKRNNEIEYNMRAIKRYSNEIKELMSKVNALKEIKETTDDFTDDIKAIMEHQLVTNIEIDEDAKDVYIYTDYIDIFDENGNRFRGNKYKILFDYRNMSVRFFGLDSDYNRRSYWTDHDPHPHVDGDGGRPCLGDAGSMLIQTMNDYELYASFIIAVNFLQQVNTDDPAGRYIYNWDCIDDEDNVIDNPYKSEMYECHGCNWITDDEDAVTTCDDCGEDYCEDCISWVSSVQEYVCSDCLDKNYVECEECGKHYRPDDLSETQSGLHVCERCADYYYIHCEECGELVRDTEKHTYDGDDYCEECYMFKLEEEADDMEDEE